MQKPVVENQKKIEIKEEKQKKERWFGEKPINPQSLTEKMINKLVQRNQSFPQKKVLLMLRKKDPTIKYVPPNSPKYDQ